VDGSRAAVMLPNGSGGATPRLSCWMDGGRDGNRTRVRGFADRCLSHSATRPSEGAVSHRRPPPPTLRRRGPPARTPRSTQGLLDQHRPADDAEHLRHARQSAAAGGVDPPEATHAREVAGDGVIRTQPRRPVGVPSTIAHADLSAIVPQGSCQPLPLLSCSPVAARAYRGARPTRGWQAMFTPQKRPCNSA
jgi:hypothetical protein